MTKSKTRKMKLSKNFAPPSFDEDDEFSVNGIFEFNITKLTDFIRANPLAFPVETVSVADLTRYAPNHVNEKHVSKVNVETPIILAEIGPGRYNVIDGNHRLEKARREGMETIRAYRVAAEQHVSFLKSVRAHEAYVGYWNSKLDER